MTAFDNAVNALGAINLQDLRREVEELRAIKDWAMAQLDVDFKPGDRVVIVSSQPSSVERGSGWYHYREALAPGQSGIAGEIEFNTHTKRWSCLVGMDRSWSVTEERWREPVRYWNGPAAETPEGFEPPSAYSQEHYPNGKVKHFAMRLEWLAKAPEQPEPCDHPPAKLGHRPSDLALVCECGQVIYGIRNSTSG